MNEERKLQDVKSTARRRLMRGTIAAPAVLTLYSGSSFAATSNLRCVSHQVANNPTTVGASPTIDTVWVRVRLWTIGFKGTGADVGKGTFSSWVRGADIVSIQGPGMTPYLGSSDWQCFAAETGSGYTPDQRISREPTRTDSTATQNGDYVACRMDATGRIIGVCGIGEGGSAMPQTCWVSFKAGV